MIIIVSKELLWFLALFVKRPEVVYKWGLGCPYWSKISFDHFILCSFFHRTRICNSFFSVSKNENSRPILLVFLCWGPMAPETCVSKINLLSGPANLPWAYASESSDCLQARLSLLAPSQLSLYQTRMQQPKEKKRTSKIQS